MFADQSEYIDKKFKVLLDDAVYFLAESERLQAEKTGSDLAAKYARRWNSHARASINNTVLLLENTANVLIDFLNLGSVAFDAIDRRPALEKYAYYLEVKHPDSNIDKSATCYKKAKELIDYRNTIVHAKPYRSTWQRVGETRYLAEIRDTPLLKLPYSLLLIDAPQALSAIMAALEFLEYYFLRLCKYEHFHTHSLLMTDWGGSSGAIDESWCKWVERWNLPITFFFDVFALRGREAGATFEIQRLDINSAEK